MSTGSYDDGIGEQEDVRAALAWVERTVPGLPLVVGGLSFGSMVGLGVGAGDGRVKALLALGTPIHIYDYSYLARTSKPVLVIQGELDSFGCGSAVRKTFASFGDHVRVEVVPGAGHLFEGYFRELQARIREYFTRGPGSRVLGGPGEPEKERDP